MKICILGPFRLEDGGQQVVIGAIRQSAVLARRLVDANEVAPSERLLVDPWAEDSPRTAAKRSSGGDLTIAASASAGPPQHGRATQADGAIATFYNTRSLPPTEPRGGCFVTRMIGAR
jgi:hypothetical protein